MSNGDDVLEQPLAQQDEDIHTYTWPGQQIRMTLERFAETRESDVRCEVKVESIDPFHGEEPIPLKVGQRLILGGPASRRDLVKALSEENPQFPWSRMVEQVCYLALQRHRQGTPSVDLADVELGESVRYLMRPVIPAGSVVIWYGSGGEAKSMLALAHMVAVAYNGNVAGTLPESTGKGMYLDWEDDDATHAERMQAILRGMEMRPSKGRIIYKRMATTLADSARDLRTEIIRENVKLVIVDSVGMAAGGDPSDANAIIRCMTACRQLGVTVIAIHHLAKPQDGKKQNKDTPYGSIYAVNEARSTWLVEKDEDSTGMTLRVAMTNKKANRSRLQPRQAFTIDFTEGEDGRLIEVRFRRLSFLQSANIGTTDRKWKILSALKDHEMPMTVAEIAEATLLTEENVRDGLKSNPEMFTEMPNPDGRAKLWTYSREEGTEPPVAAPQDAAVGESAAVDDPF